MEKEENSEIIELEEGECSGSEDNESSSFKDDSSILSSNSDSDIDQDKGFFVFIFREYLFHSFFFIIKKKSFFFGNT